MYTLLTLTIVMFITPSLESQRIAIEDARIRGTFSVLNGTIEVKCGQLWYTSCLYSYLAPSEKNFVCNQHYQHLYKYATDNYHTDWGSVENGTVNHVRYIHHNETCNIVTRCTFLSTAQCPGLQTSAPEISVANSTQIAFPEKTVETIVCKAKGGIPAPSIRIVPREGSNIISGPTSGYTRENQTNPEQLVFYTKIMVNLSHEDNGAVYKCEVDQDNFASQTHLVTLNVLYAPIIKVPVNITVNEGSEVTIECKVRSNPLASVGWYDPDGTKISGLAIMNLQNVKSDNMKNYSCIAENTFQDSVFTNNRKTELFINYIDLPVQVFGKEHAAFQINCTVISYTELTEVTWNDGENTVISNSAILSFNNLSRGEEGNYTCKSKHKIGTTLQTMSKTTMLSVAYPPVVDTPSNFTANDRDDVMLQCFVDSNPISNVTWYNGAGIAVSSTSLLELKNVNYTHAGEYTCRAQNVIHGLTYTGISSTSLFINFGPIVSVSQNTTGFEFEDIVIECEVLSYPLSTVIWKNQNNEEISNSSSLRLNYVRTTDAGMYTCIAENVIQHNLYTANASTTLYLSKNPRCYVPNIPRIKQHCRCNKRCPFLKNIRNITTKELEQAMEQTKIELTVDTSTLTKFIIQKISMKDTRSSSIGIGVIGIIVILLALGFLSSGDIIGLVKHCDKRMKRNAKKNGKRRKRKLSGSSKKKFKKGKKVNDMKKKIPNSEKEKEHVKFGSRASLGSTMQDKATNT